jgi:ABC-type spermidine/putrescine transport system permease subunit II
VGPALLVTLVLFAAPMVMVILTSLYRRTGGTTDRTLSLDNYVRLATDSTIHQALLNSLEVVGLTVFFSTLVA